MKGSRPTGSSRRVISVTIGVVMALPFAFRSPVTGHDCTARPNSSVGAGRAAAASLDVAGRG
jgi:hypothetical protein